MDDRCRKFQSLILKLFSLFASLESKWDSVNQIGIYNTFNLNGSSYNLFIFFGDAIKEI